MNILHLHPGPDTGGQSGASKAVFEAAGDAVRVFVRRAHPFGYGAASLWHDDDEVAESYRWADVVVVHNDPSIVARLGELPERFVVVHHHGSRFRNDPDGMWEAAKSVGASRQVVSTVDLLLSVPRGERAEWMPQVVDLRRMAALREALAPPEGARPSVSHAPTNHMIKGTRHVTRTMRELRREADYVLIQSKPWNVCLALKAGSDIFIDQLLLGYGNNAIEAWAMGMPVVAGASAPILDRMLEEYGTLPFVAATPATLTERVRELIASRDLREHWAEVGRAHVTRWHAPAAWLERTRRLYSPEAIGVAA